MVIGKNNLCGWLAFVVIAGVQPASASADSVDPLIEGAKLCTRNLQRYETQYGIPAHLLSAIASTESGRYHDGLKIKLPWPWTINAEGKGYYFDTKEEAMAAAHKLYDRGVESMDVGCMQVNLHHHAGAFSSLSQAFDPETNVAYAASFLRNLYQDEGSWKKAASDYHSKTPQLGRKYVGLVYDSWIKIVDKLRSARLSVPNSSVNGLHDMQQADAAPAKPVAPAPKYISVAKAENSDAAVRHMRTIKISSNGVVSQNMGAKKRESGVIIVHPEIRVANGNTQIPDKNLPPEPMVMADATPVTAKQSLLDLAPSSGSQPSNTAVVADPVSQAKIIRLDNKLADRRPVNTDIIKKSGPNFIFND